MSQFIRFAVLGLGPAAIYTLAGQGIVLIRQGTGILNIAHGAFGLLAAVTYVQLGVEGGWPTLLAAIVAITVAALGGGLVHVLVFWPLRWATDLVRLIANIAIFVVLMQAVILWQGSSLVRVGSYFPSGGWTMGDILVQYDRVIMFVIAVALTVVLWVLSEKSVFGIAIRAASSDRTGAEALGFAPFTLGLATWVIGAGLAGLAAILMLPISGYAPVTLTLVILPAFAAALLGGLRSYPLCLAGALAVGVGQSLLVRYGEDTVGRLPGFDGLGWSDAVPFVAIVIVLSMRGSTYPRRDELMERLPAVARSRAPMLAIVAAVALVSILVATGSRDLSASVTTSTLAFLLIASLVVIVGLSGQVSLAQYTIAGVAALVAGRLSQAQGLPFLLALALGVAAAAVAGAAFALPALRTRGVTLAIVTLGLSAAVEKVLFANPRYVGGLGGTRTEMASFFGWEFGAGPHPERFAIVALVIAGLVTIVVANLRSGSLGRRLLAVRSNELAAGSLGIDPPRSKVLAFALGSGVAGVAGVLMGYRFQSVDYAAFGYFDSIVLVLFAVIGGVGYLTGAVLASLLVPGGILEYLSGDADSASRWISLGTGLALIALLRATPDGLAEFLWRRRSRAVATIREERRPDATPPATPIGLMVDGLTVKYGGVVAVDDVSLLVQAGSLVGLIGANGAGKSSFLDAVTGYTPVTEGSVRLGTQDLTGLSPSRRARAGVARSFQHVELFDDLNVAENLAVAAENRLSWASRLSEIVRPAPARIRAEQLELLHALGLEDDIDREPDDLPLGRRRLLSVAQAVSTGAPIVLLDEPAAGLDDDEADELARTLRWLVDERGLGIILIEHRLDLVLGTCDHIVALDFGSVIFRGTPDEARSDDLLRAVYLGEEAAVEQAKP